MEDGVKEKCFSSFAACKGEELIDKELGTIEMKLDLLVHKITRPCSSILDQRQLLLGPI